MKANIVLTIINDINGEQCERNIVLKSNISKEFAQDFTTLTSGR